MLSVRLPRRDFGGQAPRLRHSRLRLGVFARALRGGNRGNGALPQALFRRHLPAVHISGQRQRRAGGRTRARLGRLDMSENLAKVLETKHVLVVCGTGGVGKTSVSAALALAAAMRGRRVGLVTTDPAKRLASALGLTKLDAIPKRLDSQIERALGKKMPGSLSALMFDAKDALDRFVEATGGKELLTRMRANNIYKILAGNFSGAHEYLALEKLYELEASGKFDLIVLDTPPARHTLDFLDAPDKIAAFFDDRIFQWFLTDPRSGGILERMRARGTQVALALLERVTGEGVLRDFTRLAPHLHALKSAFVARQSKIQAILASEASCAIFVATGLTLPQRDFHSFCGDAIRRELRPAGLVVNR